MDNFDTQSRSPTPRRRHRIAPLRNLIALAALALLTSANCQPLVSSQPEDLVNAIKPLIRNNPEGPLAYMLVSHMFFSMMERGQFASAGTLLQWEFQSRERFTDGQWLASMTIDAYAQYLKLSPPSWNEQWAVIQSWRHAEPRNGDAAIVEATYWLS